MEFIIQGLYIGVTIYLIINLLVLITIASFVIYRVIKRKSTKTLNLLAVVYAITSIVLYVMRYFIKINM